MFGDETKFANQYLKIYLNSLNWIHTKPDISKYIDKLKIQENCKNLIPPTIITEMGQTLFSNIQQSDKSLQKVLGLAIVPM